MLLPVNHNQELIDLISRIDCAEDMRAAKLAWLEAVALEIEIQSPDVERRASRLIFLA